MLLLFVLGVTSAFTHQYQRMNSDLVWFEVDENGNAIDPSNGTMGSEPPINCAGNVKLCARALSISQGEVSLLSGSTTVYQINPGYSTSVHYDDERLKP